MDYLDGVVRIGGLIIDAAPKAVVPPATEDPIESVCWTQYKPINSDDKYEWRSLDWREQLAIFAYINRRYE